MIHSPHHIRAFTLFCFFGAILSLTRIIITGSTDLILVWNLILALLPYFFAVFAVRQNGWIHYMAFFLWFLFLPNSFYIWTDFVHVGEIPDMLHFDIVYISVMAMAGLVCGFASLEIVHQYWKERFHKKLAWIGVNVTMLIGIYGVYVGRFLRLNSWDLIDSPLLVIQEVWNLTISNGHSLLIQESHRVLEAHRYSVGMTSLSTFIVLYFSFFMMIYVSIYHAKQPR